jgi:iron-sulfur cluster repair protein YtfE (RIC family)
MMSAKELKAKMLLWIKLNNATVETPNECNWCKYNVSKTCTEVMGRYHKKYRGRLDEYKFYNRSISLCVIPFLDDQDFKGFSSKV